MVVTLPDPRAHCEECLAATVHDCPACPAKAGEICRRTDEMGTSYDTISMSHFRRRVLVRAKAKKPWRRGEPFPDVRPWLRSLGSSEPSPGGHS